MRFLTLTFFLAIVLHLVVGVDVANALPQCTDQSYRHNCEDTVYYPNGDKYVGAFKDDMFHGQGTATYANGEKYVGEWKDNNFHGQGTKTIADGRIEIRGFWEAGVFLNAPKSLFWTNFVPFFPFCHFSHVSNSQ